MLSRVADLILENRQALAETLVAESGVPWKDSDNEVARAAKSFRLSAEEARRLVGEVVPIQGAAGQSHRMAFTIRTPSEVVGGVRTFIART
ncbi:aldehyde dehydrogenase family protein [Brevundimonas vesicularis]|uniref:aldehyde dehydrogenase family protein n=1 Tax=Brevundimonas vesicularis TaxID=41276 RepID=UPI0022EC3B81|nr:aldehyde dehydrogenase family protein [Brevundimonas vesicularis]WBT07326.1 aldehyde dehydrogenase family protein [Brevundimonas vesicularis]